MGKQSVQQRIEAWVLEHMGTRYFTDRPVRGYDRRHDGPVDREQMAEETTRAARLAHEALDDEEKAA